VSVAYRKDGILYVACSCAALIVLRAQRCPQLVGRRLIDREGLLIDDDAIELGCGLDRDDGGPLPQI